MDKFQELQEKHLDLLRHYETNKDSADFIKDVREYTEQVLSASREISEPRARNQLRANLRFWGAYIYDHTGTYPNLNLLPSEGKPPAPTPTPTPPPAPKTRAPNQGIFLVAFLVFAILVFLIGWAMRRNQRYSAAPESTNTAINPGSLFGTAIDQTSQPPLSDVASLATGTALALTPSVNAATASATSTPFALSTPTAITASPVFLPSTGGGDQEVTGHAYATTEIRDSTSCADYSIHISLVHDFPDEQAIEPVLVSVAEVGSLHKFPEETLAFGNGETLEDGSKRISADVLISPAKGSYWIYLDHPRFTFDAILVQYQPDCRGDQIDITYRIPTDDYEQLADRKAPRLTFDFLTWGPEATLEGVAPALGVAKIRVGGLGDPSDDIVWVSEGFGAYDIVQNEEFIAFSSTPYFIAVTSQGKTTSIPFRFVTPYVGDEAAP